ncbi:MAG: sulfatase [Planctomycetes bacterium]|nr:sulfatase [Planctomycetota bacterium]
MTRSLVAAFTLVSGLVFGLLAATSCGAEPAKPDHVVLIVVDTLRADRTTPYGHSRDTSPTLARIAKEGVLFENAVSQSSWTSPSMVSLMTGKYLAGERLTIPDEAPTLAESFQRAGYETAAFICNDILSEKTKFSRGFDVFEQLEPYSDDARIVQWLESAKGKRTFTWIHLAEPHDVETRYGPPSEADQRYMKGDNELPPGRVDFLRQFASERKLDDFEPSVERIKREHGGYDDDVAYADRRIANYVAALERAGLYGATAIMIAADHGEGLWTREAYDVGYRQQHVTKGGEQPTLLNLLMGTHGNQVYRELVHVPLILKAPGLGPETVVKSWVENLDIVPTLFELCDLPAATALHGKSLVALARAPGSDPTRKVFSMTRYCSSVIDEHGLQLILPTPDGECRLGLVTELYDLRKDPESRTNLAAAKPDVVAALTKVVEERLALGLPGEEQQLTPELRAVMQGLGYTDNGIVDERPDLAGQPTDELITAAANDKLPCVARFEAARALTGRTFDDAQRAKLTELAGKVDAVAVRNALRKALGL